MKYKKRKDHDITLVFDGWKTGGAYENRSVTGGVTVIYTRIGENADSVIKRIVSSSANVWIVISSDREISDYVWSAGSVPVQSEDFLRLLHGDFAEFSSDDQIESSSDRRDKGNPRRLSKKERAVRRALFKL